MNTKKDLTKKDDELLKAVKEVEKAKALRDKILDILDQVGDRDKANDLRVKFAAEEKAFDEETILGLELFSVEMNEIGKDIIKTVSELKELQNKANELEVKIGSLNDKDKK